MSSVEMTLIDGSIVRRRLDQMNMGRVESEPITKNVMMNSSKESANASEVAPTRIGQICGSVTLPEDLERGRAQVGGSFLEGRVEPVEGRLGDQQEEREDVDEVRDGNRHERELEIDAAEETSIAIPMKSPGSVIGRKKRSAMGTRSREVVREIP